VAAFDAIVSKQVGLPALLAVVDDNLTDLAELQIALQAERARDVLREEQARRRQRMRALLGAAPGLVMAGVFGAGLLWASASLKHVDAAIGAARQTTALSAGTTALIGAMANAEMSQRSYLATGGAADRQAFNNDITQVDRLLVAPGSLVADGAAGFDPAHGPLPMIEGRLQALSEQVASHHPTPMRPGPETNSAMAGRDLAEALRIWASDLVTASQTAVLTGLAALQDNIRLVLAVLSAGLLYGLWTSARSWQRLRNSASATPQAQALRVRSHRSRPRRLLLGDAGA
jgi:CHASE3 domain sensor protein